MYVLSIMYKLCTNMYTNKTNNLYTSSNNNGTTLRDYILYVWAKLHIMFVIRLSRQIPLLYLAKTDLYIRDDYL